MTEIEENELRATVEALRDEVNDLLSQRDDLTRRLSVAEANVDALSSSVTQLETALSDVGGGVGGGGGDGGGGGSDGGADETQGDEENNHVAVPDSFELQNLETPRKSIDYTPERANAHQLHEFDTAPTAGLVRLVASSGSGSGSSTSSGASSGQSVTLSLVAPDGRMGAGSRWMVPLREVTSGGIVLHWANIGNSVTFDVGTSVSGLTPCPPELTATICGTNVVVCLQNFSRDANGDCQPDGDPDCVTIPIDQLQIDCETIRSCVSGVQETVVTDVFVSGDGNLYKTIRTAKALAWGDPSDVMIVSGTTCDEGSVTA